MKTWRTVLENGEETLGKEILKGEFFKGIVHHLLYLLWQ